MNKFRLGKQQALVSLVAVLLVGTLMPGSIKAAIEAHLWQAIPWPALAHLVLFGAIAFSALPGRGLGAVLQVLVLAATLAVGTEFLQSFVPGRHPSVCDAMLDLAGALVGLGFGLRSLRAFSIEYSER